jgi:hypothetical protein
MANSPVTNFGMGAQPSPDAPRQAPRAAPRRNLIEPDYDEPLRRALGLQPGQPITPEDLQRLEQAAEWYRGLNRANEVKPATVPNHRYRQNIWDR